MRARAATLWLGLALTACGSEPPARPPAPRRGPVVAEVDGVAIHRAEVEARMRHEGLTARAALDRLIEEELTIEAARRLGLEPDRDLGHTRRRAEVQALLAREVEAKFGPADVGAAEIAAAWQAARQLEADHLLVKLPAKADAGLREKARAFAREVGQAARRTTDREAFVALATAMRSPGLELVTEDLGRFRRDGTFVREFEDNAFRMTRAGEVSEPFETSFGWHVVRLRAVTNGFGESLEAARDRVIEQIVITRRRALYEGLVQRLERGAKVEIDASALSRLDHAP